MNRRIILAFLFAVFCSALPTPARAQVFIIPNCGTVPASMATLTAGRSGMLFIDTSGNLCSAASVSASITGFPTIQTTGTPISVTTGGVTGTLPSGAVVVASNVGTTNAAYCKLGASATTSDQYIAPNGGWFAFTVGAATQLTCITSASTTTVNMVGGSGLATGTGGGSGSGSSSAITSWGGGTLGAMATYGTSPGAVLVPGANVFVTNALTSGQKSMANSGPVVIASDQSSIPVAATLGAETTKVIGTTRISAMAAAARNFPGCSVTTSSAQCLAGSTAVNFLQVQNTGTTNAIACAFGATAVLNNAGSFQLAAGQGASWGPKTGGVPTGALNCIAATGTTPLFLEWN